MKPASRLRRRLLIVAGLIVLYTLTGFFLAPVIVKSQLEKRLSAELGRRTTVEKVRVNPYAISLTLENFAIRESDGTTPFVGWRRLYVNVDVVSSLWKEWAVDEIALDGFAAKVALKPDGSPNFADILAKVAPPAGSAAPVPPSGTSPASTPSAATPKARPGRPVRVDRLNVADARLDFSDASARQPFATTLGPVTFTLTDFRTVSERGAPYRFAAVTESGEKLAWSGTLQAEPLHSVGEFALENFLLTKYGPYHAHYAEADLVDGKLSVRGRYDLNLSENQRTLKLIDGAVQLRDLKVLERASRQPALELPAIDVAGINADAVTLKAKIDSVTLTGGAAHVRRAKDGSLNFLAMLPPANSPAAKNSPSTPTASPATSPSTAPPPAAGSKPLPKPDVLLGEFALKDFRVAIDDQAASRPAQLALNGMSVSLRNVTLAEGAVMPLQFSTTWAPQGTLRVAGNVSISPVKADLQIDVAALEILPLSPYLEQFANARLTQGAVTTKLNLQAELPAGQPPAATVTGDINVEKFGLVDAARNEDLTGFGSLALRGLRAATRPELSVALEEVNLAGPYARAVMNQDKTLNLASIVRRPKDATPLPSPPPSAAAPTTAPAPTAPKPRIEIGKIVISDGDYRFTDRSLEPNVNMAINQFGGTITGLSSTNPAKADLDLKATVNGAGPIAIVGKIDPLAAAPSFDLKVDFKNVDLTPLSAYSGKFAGYELARGKLMLDVKALVAGDKIDATNVITLNQFTFGGPVKSPDATGLPVRLGVALLKDLNGNIVIDVPVQGSTKDPSFSVGRVVLRVVVNLLTKAAVSPFSLLGAAFGGGGDELAFQEFAPGAADLQAAEMKKLETMVKALTNRPGLNLDLQGSFDPAADTFALKRSKLADAVRRVAWETKRLQDPNIPPPEKIVLTPEEHGAALKKMYDEKFPPGTEFGTPLPKPPVVTAPPPAPRPGLFKRVVSAITFQGSGESDAAAKEKARVDAEHAQAVAAAVATGLPVEEMTGRLAEAMAVNENDLRALADARAQRVRDYFATEGKVSPERLFLSKDQAGAAGQGKGPRVFLSLQ